MRVFGCCLALLAGALIGFGAPAQEPAKDAQATNPEALPSWAPGPLATEKREAVPGRVAARNVGVAFTLPQAWRADDVSWRELSVEEAKAINPMADAALRVDLSGGTALLTVYRVPMKSWREADRDGKAGPGRVALTNNEIGYVVVRPPEPSKSGRYATLHDSLEDVIGTLVLYDAHHEEPNLLPKIGSSFAGVSADGSPRTLKLDPDGRFRIGFGPGKPEVDGRWTQREAQIIGRLRQPGEGVSPMLLFHIEGTALVVTKWDEKQFGNIGVRMEAAE